MYGFFNLSDNLDTYDEWYSEHVKKSAIYKMETF